MFKEFFQPKSLDRKEVGPEARLSDEAIEKIAKVKQINTQEGRLTTERQNYVQGVEQEKELLGRFSKNSQKSRLFIKATQLLGDRIARNPDQFLS